MGEDNRLPRIVEKGTTIRERRDTYTDKDGNEHTSFGTEEVDRVKEVVERECPACGYDRADRTREGDTVTHVECRLCHDTEAPWIPVDAFEEQ